MGWGRFFQRRQWDTERTRELEAYLEAETAENIGRGMAAGEARAAALKKLGNPTLIREEIYGMNTIAWLDTFWQDLRYGLRVLRKSPVFAVAGVLSLGLGIGANTTVFSVVHAVLLRSLPYPEPGRLVRVGRLGKPAGAVSLIELEFWKEHDGAFAASAGYTGASDRLLIAGDRNEWIQTMPVTADFFRTLGVVPALGREFGPEEARQGGPRAVILSHGLWLRAFGADPRVAGRAVTIDNATYNVIGVLPAGFWFPEAADAFVPLRPSGTVGDTGANHRMIARLKPGVSLSQARAQTAALAESFLGAHKDFENYRGLTAGPYQDSLVGDVRTNLLLLFGAVALLLLIGCFNLAGLLLARLAARRKEIAMRLALGSSRGRLLRQFLIENTLLTLAGGLAGLLGARVLLDVLLASVPFQLPSSAPIRLDGPVLLFTLAVALATGLAFSLAPLLSASRLDLHEALKAGGRSGGAASRQRARNILVTGEVALSVTLLFAAGLLIHTVYRMHREPLGFDPHGLMTFRTPSSAQQRRNTGSLHAFEAALLERLRAMPEVRGAAATSVLPLTSQNNYPAEHDGHPGQDIGGMEIRVITPSYLETMGIPVVLGRAFTARDTAAGPPVILVNQTVARAWWGGGSPLGDRVAVGRFRGKDLSEGTEKPREVVGVVADTKSVYLKDVPRPTVYLPWAQAAWYDSGMNWVVRGTFPAGFAERLRWVVAEADSRQKVDRVRSMDAIVAATKLDSRFNAWLFGMFAGLALALTAVGVYGLLAFSVAQRTAEIGTRMALGASRARMLAMVLKQGVGLVAIGLAAGLAAALAVGRSLGSMLFGVHAADPFSLFAVSLLLLAVGAVSSYFPARRATRVDPVVALREE